MTAIINEKRSAMKTTGTNEVSRRMLSLLVSPDFVSFVKMDEDVVIIGTEEFYIENTKNILKYMIKYFNIYEIEFELTLKQGLSLYVDCTDALNSKEFIAKSMDTSRNGSFSSTHCKPTVLKAKR